MVPPLVLASNSPRRKELLALTGWDFTIQPADVDESLLSGEHPVHSVQRLAEKKARAIAGRVDAGQIVLAADTIVVLDGQVLGKPADQAEAGSMLRQLRDRIHQVFTAYALFQPAADRLVSGLCQADVKMRAYSEDEIDAYIASGDPLDKAGAYAIQNKSFHPVEQLKGCYACVVGLPICQVVEAVQSFGLPAIKNMPEACQDYLKEDCNLWRTLNPA